VNNSKSAKQDLEASCKTAATGAREPFFNRGGQGQKSNFIKC